MRCYTESMSAVIATCFSLSLLFGNLCPQKLLAFTDPATVDTAFAMMTPADGAQLACVKRMTQKPITLSPSGNGCASGHCIIGNGSVAFQDSSPAFSSPYILATYSSPLPLAIALDPALLPSPLAIGPPLPSRIPYLNTIVLRI